VTTIANLPSLKARLSVLKNQAARYGISADPHITIEIRDLDEVIGQMGLIDIHRRNLVHLLRQRSHFGADVPAHIINSIVHEREEIATRRAYCAKRGYPVDAHEVDADAPPTPAATGYVAPEWVDPIDEIRAAIKRIETALTHINKKIDRLSR